MAHKRGLYRGSSGHSFCGGDGCGRTVERNATMDWVEREIGVVEE